MPSRQIAIVVTFVAASALPLTLSARTDAEFAQAKAAYERQEYDRAEAEFLRLALGNDSRAQYYLGVMNEQGEVRGGRNYPKAIEWLSKSAKQGNGKAQYRLGSIYFLVEDHLDHPSGVRWLTAAALQGNMEAQTLLGEVMSDWTGIPPDFTEALRWYGMAADQGSTSAQYALARLLSGRKRSTLTPDIVEALKWLIVIDLRPVNWGEAPAPLDPAAGGVWDVKATAARMREEILAGMTHRQAEEAQSRAMAWVSHATRYQ